MHWRKWNLWRTGIIVAGILLFLFLMTGTLLSTVSAQGSIEGTATPTPVTAQATPTMDATMTALQKEQLILQNKQLQQNNDRGFDEWLWSNAATIVSSFLSTLVVVIGALIGFWQWRVNRNDTLSNTSKAQEAAQGKELEDRKAERDRRDEEQKRWLRDQEAEREKRAEERFQAVIAGLGSKDQVARAGAAIMLRTFLQKDKGYEKFHQQVFDLAVTHLRLRLPTNPQNPEPPDSLSQALIVVFKEAVLRVREGLERDKAKIEEYTKFLDASRVRLDSASLDRVDLSDVYMREASFIRAHLDYAVLRGTQLMGVDLTEADLYGADFTGAYLWRTHPETASSLKNAILNKTKGLTEKQLEKCEEKGAIAQGAIIADESTIS